MLMLKCIFWSFVYKSNGRFHSAATWSQPLNSQSQCRDPVVRPRVDCTLRSFGWCRGDSREQVRPHWRGPPSRPPGHDWAWAPQLGGHPPPPVCGAGHTVSRWRWRSDDWLAGARLQAFIGGPTRRRSRSWCRRDHSHARCTLGNYSQWAIIHSGKLSQARDTAPLQLCETLVQIWKM